MKKFGRTLKIVLSGTALCFSLLSTTAFAQHYIQTNLVSDIPVTPAATIMDPNLKNPWGLVASPGSPWWSANNAGGTATLYSVTNANPPVPSIVPINGTGIVMVPNAPSQPAPGSPTGVMFNGSATDFLVAPGKAAHFLFVTEDGTVQGWNSGASAVIKVDNSQKPNASNGAVYKGATIVELFGARYILAANFRSGRVDIFDTNFNQIRFFRNLFNDFRVPRGYAPFNVQAVGENIYVTYAKQDSARHDPQGGAGFGFVAVFHHDGRLIGELEHGWWLNAPWGITLAPANFGRFSHALLVGQFRGGTIAAYNPITGHFLGNVLNADGTTMTIPGLWTLSFGNNGASGSALSMFFTAGINHETDGLFGAVAPVGAEQDGLIQ
jgi:uncharacterized protein (TIGR03118 family)